MLKDYEFQIETLWGDTIMFNGDPNPNGTDKYFIDVTSIDGMDIPPITSVETVYTTRGGASFSNRTVGLRTLVISGTIYVYDVKDVYTSLDKVSSAFSRTRVDYDYLGTPTGFLGDLLYIKVPGRPVMQSYTIGAGFDYSINPKFGNGAIDFVGTLKMEDPRFYSNIVKTTTTLSKTPVASLSIDIGVPNEGNAPYYPEIILDKFKGESIEFNYGTFKFLAAFTPEYTANKSFLFDKIYIDTADMSWYYRNASPDNGTNRYKKGSGMFYAGRPYAIYTGAGQTLNVKLVNAQCESITLDVRDAWL